MTSLLRSSIGWLVRRPGRGAGDLRPAIILACVSPLVLVLLVNPLREGNRIEFLAAMLVYALPTWWAFYIDRRAREVLTREERLLKHVDERGQSLQTDLASGRATLALDGETWKSFVGGAAPEQGVTQTTVRMVQSLCHEAASGRFPPIATLTQIYAAELRDGVRRLKVPQTMALRLGILGTFIGLLLALGHLGAMVQDAARDTLPISEISPLVGSMMVAFGTSVAGLLSTILIQVIGEALSLRQQGVTKRIEDTIGRVVTVLSMTLAGSELLRNLDALGDHVERLRSGLQDHEHQVRASTGEAVEAVERSVREFKDGTQILTASHEVLSRIVVDHNAAMGRVHVALDNLAGLDGRLSRSLHDELDKRDAASQRAAQAEATAIVRALAPIVEQLTANADASRATADRIAQVSTGFETTVTQLVRSTARLEEAAKAMSGQSVVSRSRSGEGGGTSRGHHLLLGVLCIAVMTNLAFVLMLLSRAS